MSLFRYLLPLALGLGLGVGCSSTSSGTSGGTLGSACTQNTQCNATLVCSAKTCQAQTTERCRTDAICDGLGKCDQVSQQCMCTAGGDCNPKIADNCAPITGGAQCQCGTSQACSGLSDTCKASSCVCGTQATACSNTTANNCTNGKCQCGSSAFCSGTTDTCNNGACTCGTTGTVCLKSCSAGKCTCAIDTDCPGSQTCQSGTCAPQSATSCRHGQNGSACNGLGTCQAVAGGASTVAGPNKCGCGGNPDCTLANTQCTSGQCSCNGVAPITTANTCDPTKGWQCGSNAACSGNADTCTAGNACVCGNSSIACPFNETCTSGKCTGPRHLFLTSNTYAPGTAYSPTSKTFASQSDANAACQAEANAANYGGHWAAVLGDKTKSAYDYLTQANGNAELDPTRNVVTVTGQAVSGPVHDLINKAAFDFSDIASWSNQFPITQFWVASDDTFYNLATNNTCTNWTTGSSTVKGNTGKATANWKSLEVNCSTAAALLCIELDQ